MRVLRMLFVAVVALALAAEVVPVHAIRGPAVRAVLFYSPSCGHCIYTREELLPPILQEYEGRFELYEIDLTEPEGDALYQAAVTALHIPPKRTGWPALIIGDTVLVGSNEIAAQLRGLIDAGIAAGGVEFPAIPGLAKALALAVPVAAPTRAAPEVPRPVVHAVLFYSEECPHCQVVLEQTLPGLRAQYGDQVAFAMAEMTDPANYQLYLQAMEAYAVPPQQQVVPAVFIGDRLLTGSEAIPAELPALVAAGLASGGVPYPALPGIQRLTGPDAPVCAARAGCGRLPSAAGTGNSTPLALTVFAGIAASVVYSVISLGRRQAPAAQPPWRALAVPLLALAGLAIAGYLTYVALSHVPAACGATTGCEDVQTSDQAYILGVPVALLGVIGYLAVLGVWAWQALDRSPRRRMARVMLAGLTVAGTVFSLYLTAQQAFVIHATCVWCLASAVVMTALMLLAINAPRP